MDSDVIKCGGKGKAFPPFPIHSLTNFSVAEGGIADTAQPSNKAVNIALQKGGGEGGSALPCPPSLAYQSTPTRLFYTNKI